MSLETGPEVQAQNPEAVERRSAKRFACCRKVLVRPEGTPGVETWAGIVYNISTSGLGVVLPYPVRAGTTLIIELWGPTPPQRVRAAVVRSTLRQFAFFHGCQFLEPLSEESLAIWVQAEPDGRVPLVGSERP
jgi:PilZ domain